jgi:hypothetical protein
MYTIVVAILECQAHFGFKKIKIVGESLLGTLTEGGTKEDLTRFDVLNTADGER